MKNELIYKKAIDILKPKSKKPVIFKTENGLEWSLETGLAKQQYYDFNTCKEARVFRRKEYLGLRSLPFMNEEQHKRFQKLAKLTVRDNHIAFNEDKTK